MASGLLRAEKNHGLSLPNELALLIIDQIALEDDKQLLCALARSCRGLQQLAEERLYRTVDLVSVTNLRAIIAAFTSRPARVRAVQSLRILYQYKPSDLSRTEGSRTTFNECIARMVNLRTWHIESPYDNFHWETGGKAWVDGDMETFRCALENACTHGPEEAERIASGKRLGKSLERTVGLALLQDLTIHSHGATTDFWDLGGFHCLFRHPTLRTLHLSCMTFPPDDLPELASHVRKSPLTTLVFDECELTPKSLPSLLRTPARLKHLTLGENVFNVNRTRWPNPLLTKHAAASFEALSAVAHSLESLTHLNPAWRVDQSPNVLYSVRPVGTGMCDFHSLTYLECDTTSFLHQAAIMNRDLAPPNLKTLRLRRHWEVDADFWDQPPPMNHYLALPSLTTLELMQSSFLWHHHAQSDYICDTERLRNRHAKAYALFKAGINLKVLIEMHRDPRLIPPYLQGERVPIVACIYDASEVGFRRHCTNDLPEPPQPSPYASDIERNINSTGEHSPHPLAKPSHAVTTSPSPVMAKEATSDNEPTPETDQLDNTDIQRIHSETRCLLDTLKRKFVSRIPHHDFDFDDEDDDESLSSGDDEWEYTVGDEFEVDDLNEDDDMELDGELGDEASTWEAENGVQVYEHDGELYFEVYDDETDSEDEEEGDEGEEEGGIGGGEEEAGAMEEGEVAGSVVDRVD